jgi:hypothetical protein
MIANDHPDVEQMALRILALAPRRLSLLNIRRRVNGQGEYRLGLLFHGTIECSEVFGTTIAGLVYSGRIQIDSRRGRAIVRPGRAFNYDVKASA